ncbi:DUF2971 domain-containing protein [Flavobacterium psychrotrophum]|uniref:DUF2971 domain-containing protein n=1 Tax=Flavobacterium psychrotrophum TaxID=2294119 RepID=UPI000E30D032|nr:DUF2971 domain-containing protein [Flavobacterium psychrotrophum]
MILYKYRNDSNFTEKIFIDKKVWLANAEALNDPFECKISEIAKDWIDEQVKVMKSGQLMGFAGGLVQAVKTKTGFYGLNSKQTNEYAKKFRARSFDQQYLSMRDFIFRKTGVEMSRPDDTFNNFDKQLNDVGIFSLTETDDNELLWAYYADSSKGIAIGFEVVEGNKLYNSEHCLKVIYTDTKPTFNGKGFKNTVSFFKDKNIQKISFDDETFRQAISTKNTTWFHEKEWRYVEERTGSYDFPGKIVEVIFGLKCQSDVREKYYNLVKMHINNEVQFFEVKIINNKLVKCSYSEL